MNILVLCTGNSCRSQMAEGFLKSFGTELNVWSAGTKPVDEVHRLAIRVMKEVGIDISKNKPQNVDNFLDQNFDFVITVCDGAKDSCPDFAGKVKKKLHIGFPDPAEAMGSEEEKLSVFKKVRDQINHDMYDFYCEITGRIHD